MVSRQVPGAGVSSYRKTAVFTTYPERGRRLSFALMHEKRRGQLPLPPPPLGSWTGTGPDPVPKKIRFAKLPKSAKNQKTQTTFLDPKFELVGPFFTHFSPIFGPPRQKTATIQLPFGAGQQSGEVCRGGGGCWGGFTIRQGVSGLSSLIGPFK